MIITKINKLLLTILTLCIVHGMSFYIGAEESSSPYGAHSHLYRPQEWRHFPKNLDVMRQGGLQWMRTDFLWSLVEPKEGTWDFSQFDKIVAEAEKRDIHILGILGYSVSWAKPAWEHPDQWSEYVTKTVSRYKGRVRFWEVWNEQNIEVFWKDPNPEKYTCFLKRTYEAAKKADPDTTILFGGTAGIPMEFIEQCLKAGGGAYFDVMNIHPYRSGLVTKVQTREFKDDIAKLHVLLEKYNVGSKPVWITEMGWSDYVALRNTCRDFIAAIFKVVSPDKPVRKVAFLYDPQKYIPTMLGHSREKLLQLVPSDLETSFIPLNKLVQLDPVETPFLILPPMESFPSPFMEHIYNYVRVGGTLVFTYGFPCYYSTKEKDGCYDVIPGENTARQERQRLRIDARVWWTASDVPKKANEISIVPGMTDCFQSFDSKAVADRFFGPKYLKEGDTMVPIIMGKTGDFEAPVALIYRFNSDLKGNIAIYSLYDSRSITSRVTPEEMGNYLPQAYLIALSSGIERFFMYQFQARENIPTEKEDHFGLVHKDLSPKTGFIAMTALTKARPAGSVSLSCLLEEEICILSWKRPDGKKGWAIWSFHDDIQGQIKITGQIDDAFNNLGRPIDREHYNISNKILYFIGPDEITFIKR